jgi:hypothetical protein
MNIIGYWQLGFLEGYVGFFHTLAPADEEQPFSRKGQFKNLKP